MPKIVALHHNKTEKRKERTQFLLYLDENTMQRANLRPGDEVEFVISGKEQFLVRKAA